jgi:predicted lipoprotein with Yx(FWY)xxD motif
MRVAASLTAKPHLARRAAAVLGAAALLSTPLVLAGATGAGATTSFLKSANVPDYAAVLEASSSHTLYVLSTEKGAKLHCTGSCLSVWHPLVVKSSVTKVSVGANVKGKVGFVKRTAATKQVTYNTYPLYTFSGDTGANGTSGEGVAADGGVWHLVHASAKAAGATPFAPILNAANIPSYKAVLENSGARSLYVLSTEKGASIKCSGGCLSIWPPLLVTSSTTSIAVGGGVKGTIGFVTRGSMKQVTFNSYPVYTYTGDNGPNQSNGENVAADGGTWTLASAGATTAGGTPVPPAAGGTGGGWARHP